MKQLEPRIDRRKINWKELDEPKAPLIYEEARAKQTEIKEACNDLNGKAFHLLSLVMALLSAMIVLPALFDWADAMGGTLTILIVGLAASALILLAAIWPLAMYDAYTAPHYFFDVDVYPSSTKNILLSAALNADDLIVRNQRLLNFRGRCIRIGTITTGLTCGLAAGAATLL